MPVNDPKIINTTSGPRGLFRFFRISFRFFGISRDTDQSRCADNHDLIPEALCDRPDCGDYNEAFVMQQWANYSPHH